MSKPSSPRKNNFDYAGREYASVTNTVVGTQLEADGDFDCIKTWTCAYVVSSYDRLCVPCSHGLHFLSGQLSDDSTHYVGFYPVKG